MNREGGMKVSRNQVLHEDEANPVLHEGEVPEVEALDTVDGTELFELLRDDGVVDGGFTVATFTTRIRSRLRGSMMSIKHLNWPAADFHSTSMRGPALCLRLSGRQDFCASMRGARNMSTKVSRTPFDETSCGIDGERRRG